uniref:Uncharacterized protein n=1 Tax=Tanacetum cinerariifolium TaxID=118510 RepID=A0A699K2H3_TANCI|nr:hypothetical protein [Tanacetum cinerariifolium]
MHLSPSHRRPPLPPATTTIPGHPPPPEKFSGEFFGQNQKCSLPLDLSDPIYHSPPRAATSPFRPHHSRHQGSANLWPSTTDTTIAATPRSQQHPQPPSPSPQPLLSPQPPLPPSSSATTTYHPLHHRNRHHPNNTTEPTAIIT